MSRVAAVETFIVTIPRDTPYLGPLAPGESVNSRGYVVRRGNGTIYPTVDRSIVVKVTCDDGSVGWGETYGICAPRATCEIINDLLAPVAIGANPADVEQVWDELYGLMRVRGCSGGFHVDAIAAIDIALWDLYGKQRGVPIRDLLGPTANPTVPGYLSGLPAATLEERVSLAKEKYAAGHRAFKFAAVVSHEGIVAEMAALRAALGPDAQIMVDLHWKFTAEEALELIAALQPHRPFFVEAPVKPEDHVGLARVARESRIAVAAGEEWYTAYEAANRLAAGPLAILQPEMGHTGITQFRRIAALAAERGATIAPHATIGTGLFLAASLQVSATLRHLWKHEWQHSVFERNLQLLDSDMGYADGAYLLPTAPGLGAAPNARLWDFAERVAG
ncbi:mandelate racemase/muconate lactonizing enzyme family protein [Peristeroidobacter agariperforans]|uniref:mandelate racemase/muconate lactonizing enzyme family protein n=1 Tax=Peristeroidobacter agariperforans TaxID=268404 RepID=UPI00101D5E64|nr:mandelate racemase/muconate lactonizing enzyme family protein [Peristeroidobacter agariperforans]